MQDGADEKINGFAAGAAPLPPVPTVIVGIGKRRYEVADIEAASALFCAARDKSGNGASKTPTPLLYRPDGEQFAHISYNGRVWAGSPRDWKPGHAPLCEAQG